MKQKKPKNVLTDRKANHITVKKTKTTTNKQPFVKLN